MAYVFILYSFSKTTLHKFLLSESSIFVLSWVRIAEYTNFLARLSGEHRYPMDLSCKGNRDR